MSKNLDIDIKKIRSSAVLSLKKLQGYSGFLFIVGILLIYSFLVYQISSLSQAEPDAADVAEQTTVKRLKVDQNAIDKIQRLEDQNIGVQSLFESARDNPFQD